MSDDNDIYLPTFRHPEQAVNSPAVYAQDLAPEVRATFVTQALKASSAYRRRQVVAIAIPTGLIVAGGAGVVGWGSAAYLPVVGAAGLL